MQSYQFFDAEGHITDDFRLLYADALKSERVDALPAEIREHVKDCHSCKESILEIYALVQKQESGRPGPHPYLDQKKILKHRFTSKILRIAAGLVIGGGLAWLGYVYFYGPADEISAVDRNTPPPVSEVPADNKVIPDTADESLEEPDEIPRSVLFAANFEPYAFYEQIVDQPFRAQLLRAIAPAPGEQAGEEILFAWQTRYEGEIRLRILNNRGENIHETVTSQQSYRYRRDLDPGIYYWRLDTEEELLYVGKFIVPLE